MHIITPIVERISHVDFFHQVGKPCSLEICMQIKAKDSWADAIALSGSNRQSDAWDEAKNLYTTNLGLNYRKEYRSWNRTVEEVHQEFSSVVFPKMENAVDSIEELSEIENGSTFLKHSVCWDLVGAAVEYAYSDIVPTHFSTLLLQVYEAGHFPCGWDRVWPNGALWIY